MQALGRQHTSAHVADAGRAAKRLAGAAASPPLFHEGEDPMEAYCVKCRTKREMKEPKAVTLKNGKPATEGICPVCGTKMMRIGKAEAAAS